MQKSGIFSTIILTLLLAISVLLMISLIPASLSGAVENYMGSFEDAEMETENTGEIGMVLLLVAGTGLLAIVVIAYLQAIIPAAISIFGLIFSLKNRNRDLGFIRFINKFYSFAFASVLLVSVVKIVMFATGY